MRDPTPYPEVNRLLGELLSSVRAILGADFVGMYLEGSLATGAFDDDSDIDFVAVARHDVSAQQFRALEDMHERISRLPSRLADQLEGSYIALQALRSYDPARSRHPNIERGAAERLKLAEHDAAWLIHLWLVRERGIVLAGPHPRSLIDPVGPDELRRAMASFLPGWAARILERPAVIGSRGYQSYVVLSLCRVLYTLEHGTIAAKLEAARWAQSALDERWAPLIEGAWGGRRHGDQPATPEDVAATLAYLRYTLARLPNVRHHDA